MQVGRQRGTSVLPASGARVSNAYATCPRPGNNRGKLRIIPYAPPFPHGRGGKVSGRPGMGVRPISLLAG